MRPTCRRPPSPGRVAAFAQVVGGVSLELAGHFVGGFEPADELFGFTVAEQARGLGLG